MPDQVKWGIALALGLGLVALGWKFTALLTALHVILCVLLILVVLLQSGKAADLAAAFGGASSQTAFGPRSAANFLTRLTTICFVLFLVTTLSLEIRQAQTGPSTGSGSSVLERTQKPAPTQAPTPFGAPTTPAQGQPTTPAGQPPAGQTTPPPQSQTPASSQPAPTQAPAKAPAKP